jgi:hypothetical protein
MKHLLILIILLTFSLDVWGSELKSGIRVGYNFASGMQVQFYEKTTGKFAQIDNYQYDNLNENLYLSYLTTPNYLYNGLG